MRHDSTLPEPSYPLALKEFSDRVTAEIAQGNPGQALDLVASRSVIPGDRFHAARDKSLELLSRCSEIYGSLRGCDLFLVEAVGRSIYRFSYLVRFKKFAVRLSLTFYGDADAYVVTDYHLSQDFEAFFRCVEQR